MGCFIDINQANIQIIRNAWKVIPLYYSLALSCHIQGQRVAHVQVQIQPICIVYVGVG